MNVFIAFTLYQIVSLLSVMWAVFAQGYSPWFLMLHVIATIWYVIITATLKI